jgi:hypothetical protein
MNIEIYKEIKIFPSPDYGLSVENFNVGVGGEGITISTYDYIKGKKENVRHVSFDTETAKHIADAIVELVD